jgi:hypothetical protein
MISRCLECKRVYRNRSLESLSCEICSLERLITLSDHCETTDELWTLAVGNDFNGYAQKMAKTMFSTRRSVFGTSSPGLVLKTRDCYHVGDMRTVFRVLELDV